MKVSNINSHSAYQKSTFKSLKLSYGVEETLAEKASANQINNFFEAGRKLENTMFFDLEVFEDLSMRIKEKGNVFSGLVEPINIFKHTAKQLRVVGVYDGVEDETHKKGQKLGVSLKYSAPETVESILKYIKPLKGVMKIAAITKLIDDYYIKTELTEKNSQQLSKRGILRVLMNKYGEIVIK
jgi:hypothetical protein